MADLPTRAQTVIVGAGIVGASAAYHLADLGVTDVLVIDQGPLFATGGSTSHAPGLVFQTNGSRTMCRIAQDSVALYDTLDVDGEPVWYGVGGLELATTPERIAELKRRQGFARSWGIEGTELLSPAECAERSPLLDPVDRARRVLGAERRRGQGREDRRGARAWRRSRRRAVRGRRHRHRVRHDRRPHPCRRDRAAAGSSASACCSAPALWGPTVGAMAGVPIPLVAVQHQLVWTDPVPELAGLQGDTWAQHPIVRHQDLSLYFRQRDDHYGVGNYRHEPIVTPQSAIRAPGGAMQPSLMPFTPEDFDLCEAETARMFPALAGRMRPSDPERSLNGMFSFTPDAGSVVGESATVRGFWVCEAVWVTHAAGMARQAVEWMVEGEPTYDLAEADANRFYPFQTTAPYVIERGKQQYREVYDILHPRQQPSKPRNIRRTPFYERHVELGASFVTGAGWERPQWFEANRELVGGVTHEWARRSGWAAREWSPIEGGEHLAVRERAGLFDLTPYVKLRVQGPDAARLPRADLREPDRPPGRHRRLHGDAHASRRDPLRPHGDPPRRGRLHGRHRRRIGDARPRVAPRAGARRRAGADLRRLEPLVRAGAVRAEGA